MDNFTEEQKETLKLTLKMLDNINISGVELSVAVNISDAEFSSLSENGMFRTIKNVEELKYVLNGLLSIIDLYLLTN